MTGAFSWVTLTGQSIDIDGTPTQSKDGTFASYSFGIGRKRRPGGACGGDSGAPLLLQQNDAIFARGGREVIFGVLSAQWAFDKVGEGQCTDAGFFHQLYHKDFYDWINRLRASSGEDF